MAISAVAGLVGVAAKMIAAGKFLIGWKAALGAFALGAGLSAVSRALAPKPDLGARLQGITQTSRDPASSRKLIYGQIRVGGQVVFIGHSGDDNTYLHLVIVFASHEIESFEEFFFNDKPVYASGAVLSDWTNVVTVTTFDGSQTTADSTLVSQFVQWTNNHVLNDMAYAHFKLKWDQNKFPQGVPNITAILKGKKIYDPRDSGQSATDSSTWTYSQNPALCVRDYLVNEKYGLGEPHGSIDTTALTAAANACDEDVSLQGGGTQDRYRCNGLIDTANQIKGNIEQILAAMGGRLTYSGGKYFIDAAGYKTPTFTFTEADCVSEIQTQTKQSRRSVYNGVKGIFVSEEKEYKVLDYPAQISSTYEAEDGDPIYLDMPLPFVTNSVQAQRLAKIALLKSRQQVALTMAVNLKGLQVKVGDTIKVTNDRLGYSEKIFEVIDYTLTITDGSLSVSLELIETASAIYDWTTSDEQDFLSGGVLDLYDGRTVDNVTSLAKNEIGLLGPDGSSTTTTELTWTAPDDAFVDFYKVRYNVNGTTNYFHAETKETRILLSGLDVTSNYDFRVQVQNLLGVTSTGTTLLNQSFSGDTTAPSPVTGVTFTRGLKNITLEWTNPTDADLAYVQIYISSTVTKPSSPSAQVRGTEYVYPAQSSEGKGTTKYFWLEAVDFSGNVSTTVGPENEIIQLPKSEEIDGDVSEIVSVGIVNFPAHTVGSSASTFGTFTVPASEDGVKKYGNLSGNLKFTTNADVDTCILNIDVQRVSKGVTSGTEIGAIVANGTVTQYYYYVEVSGNHAKEIDGYGGIATSQTSPSTIEKPLSVEYKSSTDRTRVVYTSLSQTITTGTLYYNPDRWTSAGSFLSDAAGPYRPMIAGSLGGSTTSTMPLNLPLAKSDDDEDYRVRVNTIFKSNGIIGINQLTAQVILAA